MYKPVVKLSGIMGGLLMSSSNQVSELVFTGREIDNYKFRVVEARILERLDYPFEIECICYYESINNEPDEKTGVSNLIDRNIRLYLNDPSYTNNKNRPLQSKLFIGVVSEIIYLGNKELPSNYSTNNKYYYRFKLNSQLIRLSYNRAYRIYNNKSVLEVLNHLFERSRGAISVQIDFSRVQNYFPVEEYITQYNESDLDFLLRLCSRYGIYISESDKGINFYDSVYKADFSTSNNEYVNEEVSKHVMYPYNPSSDNYLSSHCISSIEYGIRGRNLWSIFSTSESSNPSRHQAGISENYWDTREIDNRDKVTTYASNINNYHPSFTNINYQNGLQFQATLNVLSNHIESLNIKARSNILELNTNDVITITNIEGRESSYKIIGIVHYYHDKSEQGGRILEHEPSLYSMYSNELSLIPNTMPYAMKVIEKPRALGITTGVVTGNSEDINSERNSIVVDDYGRVRVQFASNVVQGRYDEEVFSGKYLFTHSCYLRYTSPAASSHSGFISVPRVGDEVVVSFIDGDPDRPIITGSLYNHETPSLIQNEILVNKHKTSLSSKTVGLNERGRNELTMSNLPNSEEIYLKAERDYKELVQNDYEQSILNNKTSKVSGIHNESILQSHIQNIAGLKDVNVGGEYLTVVALSKDTAVGLSNTLNVGAENTLRVAGDSKESVGRDKNVNVSGDYNIGIGNSLVHNVRGKVTFKSAGHYDIVSKKEINLVSDSQINTHALENISIDSEESVSMYADDCILIKAADLYIDTSSCVEINSQAGTKIFAEQELNITSGESSIILDENGIAFKSKGIEFSISEDGILIKGCKLRIKE